jgi:hypothetical protein
MAANYEIPRSLSKKIKSFATKQVYKSKFVSIVEKAEKLKQLMISEFKNHPVTREIEGENYSDNISRTLNGYGNLFTFIGFELGDKPIEPILDLFKSIKITHNSSDGNLFLRISYPSPDDVWMITPMPWQSGRSWAKGIESGISGLNYYLLLNKFSDSSRSGRGIQSENKLRSSMRYTPTQYITTILKKYRTKFSSLGKKDLEIFTSIE